MAYFKGSDAENGEEATQEFALRYGIHLATPLSLRFGDRRLCVPISRRVCP
jgi:hypothetical protein